MNVARSALSAVIAIPGIGQVGKHPLIKRLLRGVYLRTPTVPKYCTTWDVNVNFNFLRLKPESMNLNLKDLSMFTVTLLIILSAERCQTLAQLNLTDVQNDQEEITLKTVGLLKTSRPGHHKGELTLKAFPGERKLCIVTVTPAGSCAHYTLSAWCVRLTRFEPACARSGPSSCCYIFVY